MNEPPLTDDIDAVCDAFELALQSEEHPSIEDYLLQIQSDERDQALYWLLKVELAYRQSTGASIDTDSYRQRFSNDFETVELCLKTVESTDSTPPSISGYELLGVISRGGQGVVYRARQVRTGQEVAVKFIRTDYRDAIGEVAANIALGNFESEIQTVAALQHPNVIRMYDAGECQGGVYLVMQLVKGGSVSDVAASLHQYQAAKLVKQVAEAVAEAHQADILHLDIKPQNILYDQKQEHPFLIDFGLARLGVIGKHIESTAGTPGYMAPEQVTHGQLDERTDVYGLGATLYLLLTGAAPIEGDSVTQRLARSEAPDIKRPSLLRHGLDERLEQICLKCLSPNPTDRYQSASELADDLRRLEAREGGRNSVNMANGLFAVGLFHIIFNTTVGVLVALRAPEIFIWPMMFMCYAPLFYVFLRYPARDQSLMGLTQETLWGIWGGKFIAEVLSFVALRILLNDSYLAIAMAYTIFIAFTGMAVCCGGAQFWKGFYIMAIAIWILVPISACLTLRYEFIAPIMYSFAGSGVLLYATRLKKIAQRLVSHTRIEMPKRTEAL